ncbi:MAG: hypothetical protein ACYTG1_11345 [Planctomycetota bacterium]|jgi:hypothetical protein
MPKLSELRQILRRRITPDLADTQAARLGGMPLMDAPHRRVTPVAIRQAAMDDRTTRLLEALAEHLDHSRARDDALGATFGRMDESAARQAELLAEIRQQKAREREAWERTLALLVDLQRTASELTETSRRGTEQIAERAGAADRRDALVEKIGRRVVSWLIAAVAIGGVAIVIAVAAAVAAAVAVVAG